MAKAQRYQKRFYDSRHRPVEFGVGEEVLLSTRNLPSETTRKFATRYVGPFKVLQRIGT